jgi:hypothetical protein
MVTRMLLLLVVLSAASTNALGQIDAEVATQPAAQSAPLPADNPSRAEFNELVAVVRDLTASVAAIKTTGEDTANQLRELRSEVAAISDIQVEDRVQLDQLAKTDKNGRSYLRLDASHEDSREEIRQAISKSVPSTGRVTIYNEMANDQLIAINNETHKVLAKSRTTIDVPLGDFTVRLAGQSPERRSVGLPNFETNVTIVPDYSRVVVERVVSGPTYWAY